MALTRKQRVLAAVEIALRTLIVVLLLGGVGLVAQSGSYSGRFNIGALVILPIIIIYDLIHLLRQWSLFSENTTERPASRGTLACFIVLEAAVTFLAIAAGIVVMLLQKSTAICSDDPNMPCEWVDPNDHTHTFAFGGAVAIWIAA
ncbi:hypothetical protein K4F52_004702 [Lecanicillium sp. MT-2017a]|nr:hypothetical protein K4F52_004702 [Lecanicillium sp. MT-2017a]